MNHLSPSNEMVKLYPKAIENQGRTSAVSSLMLEWEKLFTRDEPIAHVHLAEHEALRLELQAIGIPPEADRLSREEFFQLPWLWHRRKTHLITPEKWMQTGTVTHPVRPEVKDGVIYKRFVPSLGQEISFEVLDPEKHLKVFHEWHNQRRVFKFWELNQSEAELKAYIEKIHADPHHFPTIAAVDGEPAGYFEIYWAAEDRLGPYYDCQPYDRGFHFLIGNRKHLGRNYFNSFVESISHFLFLDEPRTQTLLAEPRADNVALLHYLMEFPYWEKRYEFDFPHKRAALLACRRQDYFRKASFL